MRTKTLLLTAALTAAGVATSMAQAVYSVNMVGYINQAIPDGFSMIANHLNHTPDNRLETVMPNPPENTTVYQFNGSGYTIKSFQEGAWGGDTEDIVLDPGKGAFIDTTPFTHTFVGEIQLNSSLTVVPGFNIYGSVLPQKLPIDAAQPAGLNLAAEEGDQIFMWNGNGYNIGTYTEGAWGGDFAASPEPNIGEAFWYKSANAANRSWTRSFSVGP
jgi:hypothetical protein